MGIDNETVIAKALTDRFEIPEGKCKVTRQRRIFAEIRTESILEILAFASQDLGFDFLCTITGLDSGESLEFIYHLADRNGVMLNLKIFAPKSDPRIPTVTELFNGAIFYERELVDLLGAVVEGLPAGGRYPLTEKWPEGQYPLRKDWKQNEGGE